MTYLFPRFRYHSYSLDKVPLPMKLAPAVVKLINIHILYFDNKGRKSASMTSITAVPDIWVSGGEVFTY